MHASDCSRVGSMLILFYINGTRVSAELRCSLEVCLCEDISEIDVSVNN